MAINDECFPRGGFTSKSNINIKQGAKPRALHTQENLFGNKPIEKKSKGKKKRSNIHENNDGSVPELLQKSEGFTAFSADTLSYKKIQEGMTVLACVKKPRVVVVEVELPGRCFGEIRVQNISSAYVKEISKVDTNNEMPLTVDKILHPGQFLPVQIMDVDDGGEKSHVYVSCNPSDINSHLKHSHFTSEMLVWGAISEKSNHGYLIDLGVRNCRAHLPFVAVDEGVQYHIGQVLYMVVRKCVTSKEATTLTVSALRKDFNETVESVGTSLDHVIPGMQVEFLTQKILKDGLEGRFFDECTGLINEFYLKKPLDVTKKKKKYQEFQSLTARLLYVHPLSKVGYFTLGSITDPIPENKYKVGSRVAASVVAKAGSGLIVKLPGGARGYITYRRILQSLNANSREHEDLETLIETKYPTGTTKQCTVLDYNHMERLYICSFGNIGQIMNVEDLKLGQIVKGTIKKTNNHGICIRVGKIDAFAPNDNLSNVRYSENIKKQFKVGQNVRAKIWKLDIPSSSVILTLKPELLATNAHLTSYDNINYAEYYPGVVISIIPKGVLLLFYGEVKGFLPVGNIPQLGSKGLRNEFYKGQIIKCRVVDYTDGKLTLTRESLPVIKLTNSKKKNNAEANKETEKQNNDDKKKNKRKSSEVIEETLSKKKKKKVKCGKEYVDEETNEEMEVVSSGYEQENNEDKKKRKAPEIIEESLPKKKKKKEKKRTVTTVEPTISITKTPVLPGMSSFFDDTKEQEIGQESDEDDEPSASPKKKLTPAERAQKMRDEEERLRKIETELADSSILPQSAEQFDRALLGNPDDSELWTRYIAFHAQSTEFEKARSVALRALDRISYTAVQDRLNVWLAYLNLENMYGTTDSFAKTFEEATRCNDDMTIYLETIKMLADMGKFTEMEEKIKKARGKFKQEMQMWLEIGKVYYKCGRFAEARKLKDTALITLTDKKAHVQLIVQFAIMEFNFGESNHGETLFETILQADPKRVDIWCTYVDQLIKKEKIELARNVLTRGVGQKLSYKKMRTLFKKYHTFEKTYGDEQTLSYVTNLLKEYGDQ